MAESSNTLTIPAVDVELVESGIPGMPVTVRRLSSNDVGGAGLAVASLGDVDVVAGEFGFTASVEGDIAGDRVVAAMQLEEGQGSWNGQEFAPDRVWYFRPGSEHFGTGSTKETGRPLRWVTISMPEPAIPHRPDSESTRSALLVADQRVPALRCAVVAALVRADTLAPDQAALAGRELIEMIAELDTGPEAAVDRSAALWITRVAIELADELDPMPSTVVLAEMIGVSDRWLRAAFNSVFNVSAVAFFKAKAIDGARRDLLAAQPASTTVTEVAMRWGFWHLGRFSSQYRSYFGELPSQTLARST